MGGYEIHLSFCTHRKVSDFMSANIIASLQKNKLYRLLFGVFAT